MFTPMYLEMARDQQNGEQHQQQASDQSQQVISVKAVDGSVDPAPSEQSSNLLDIDDLTNFTADTVRLRFVRTLTLILGVLSLVAATSLLILAIAGSSLSPFIVVEFIYLVIQGLLGVFASLGRSVKTILLFVFLCVVNAALVIMVLTFRPMPMEGSSPNGTSTTMLATTRAEPTSPQASTTTPEPTTSTAKSTTTEPSPTTSPTSTTTTTSAKTDNPTSTTTTSTTTRADSNGSHKTSSARVSPDSDERGQASVKKLSPEEQTAEQHRKLLELVLWITIGIDIMSAVFGCFLMVLMDDKVLLPVARHSSASKRRAIEIRLSRSPAPSAPLLKRKSVASLTPSLGRPPISRPQHRSARASRKRDESSLRHRHEPLGQLPIESTKSRPQSSSSHASQRRAPSSRQSVGQKSTKSRPQTTVEPRSSSIPKVSESNLVPKSRMASKRSPISEIKPNHPPKPLTPNTPYAFQPVHVVPYEPKKILERFRRKREPSLRKNLIQKSLNSSDSSLPNALTRTGSLKDPK